MRILFVSYFCPPECAAPAARVFENATRLVRLGHDVTILTGLPNHPVGRVIDGYRWRPYQVESMDGVRVVRAGSWIAPNTTTLNRIASSVSLMFAQIAGGLLSGDADVVVGTSPPLFQALAGRIVALAKRCPFVFEVRDLWPENMVAIGALRSRCGIGLLAAMERHLLSAAARIIVVTHGFKEYYRAKGVPGDRISVITNGADLAHCRAVPRREALVRKLGLEGKFVAAYIGTVGINHGLRTMIEAAERLRDTPDVVILVVGDGAERPALEIEVRNRGLKNLRFLGARPREQMPDYHALCDVLLVVLRNAPYFRLVIPSKIFVGLAMERPVILGVDGESRRILEASGGGIFVEPEDADAVANAILQMKLGKAEGALDLMGRRGREYVGRHYNRDRLVQALELELQRAVSRQ